MGWKDAIDSLQREFKKIDLESGSVQEPIDVKIVESKLRVLTNERDNTRIDKHEFISMFPALFMCLTSSDKNLRLSVSRFLPALKDLIDATSCNYNDWKSCINSEFVKLCAERFISIVEELSDDWIEPWLLLVNILFTDVEGRSFSDISLFNQLLRVVEKAFKVAKSKTDEFKNVFKMWERFCTILAESLSCNKFLTSTKRLQLLVLPFISINNLKADPFKHKAWFHIVEKIGLHSAKTVEVIVAPFLHFLIETRRMFINCKDDVASYLKVLSQNHLVVSKYTDEILKCLELAVVHDSSNDDIVKSWTNLCAQLTAFGAEGNYLKKLVHLLKIVVDTEKRNELMVELCLIAHQHKMFDFKSIYFNDITPTLEEVFPVVVVAPLFREKVLEKTLAEMLDIIENLQAELEVDEEGCMSPILSMWELIVNVYSEFVDASLDSRFVPEPVDSNIIKYLLLIPLTQPLIESPLDDSSTGKLLSLFLKCLVKKSKTDIFSADFLKKLGSLIQLSKISLDNCLWFASFISNLNSDINMIPLLSVISKSITSCNQPKAVLEFLHILDKATEKTGVKMNFKAMLNFLRKFSSAFEPPYDQQIRQISNLLLKRLLDVEEKSPNSLSSCESEEKKHNVRTPTFSSNFLMRLSKAEEKRNGKNILASSIFPRSSEEAETNKENKQSLGSKNVKPDDINLSPNYRFAKSPAFVLDTSDSSETVLNNSFEPKMANFKVSTDFHKTVSPAKLNGPTRIEAGLSPKLKSVSKVKEETEGLVTPKTSPLNDKFPNSEGKSPRSQPSARNKYNFLDHNSSVSQDFVFVPPKNKVSPLTKHQKEMMNKRREEIPALYQDLSQDTQNTSELSSTDHSSQENSSFYARENKDNLALNAPNNDRHHENITCVTQENTIFSHINDNCAEDEVDLGCSKLKEDDMTARRLNFEGICENVVTPKKGSSQVNENNSSDVCTPSRKLARRSTSKYRKKSDDNQEMHLNSPQKKKCYVEADDNTVKTPSRKDIASTDDINNKASPAPSSNNSLPKKRGRKKKVSINKPAADADVCVKTENPSNSSPQAQNTTTSLTSVEEKTDSKNLAILEYEKKQALDSSFNLKLEENEKKSKRCDEIISENLPATISESDVTSNKFTKLKACSKRPLDDSTPDLDIAKKNKTSCDITQNISTSNPVEKPEFESKANGIGEDTGTNTPVVNTPPSSDTPNRRKKNKKPIKFNEFSPKMLRRGKVIGRTSPKGDKVRKIVRRKSFSLEKSEPSSMSRKQDSMKVDSESKNVIDVASDKTVIINVVGDVMEHKDDVDRLSDKQITSQPVREVQNIEDVMEKLVSNPKTSSQLFSETKQDVKDGKVAVTSKTSPTRAMKIILMLNNTPLHNISNQTETVKEDSVKSEIINVQSPVKMQKKFNSRRTSLIMKNVQGKIQNPEYKVETKPMESNDREKHLANNLEYEPQVSVDNNECENDTTQVVLQGKRKSFARSPLVERKAKKEVSKINLNQSGEQLPDQSTPNVKRTCLDNWVIKKDKAIIPNENSSINQPELKTEVMEEQLVGETETNNTPVENSMEIEMIKANESVSVLLDSEQNISRETDNAEIDINEGSSDSSFRWPKRCRTAKKPTEFVYSPLKRNKSSEIRTPIRKQKQDKQIPKPYSFVNWPKGDCEAWVAFTPTPPEKSPTSAILKRNTAHPSPNKAQISPNVTPKKRVNFLDPPVSTGLLYSRKEPIGEIQHASNEGSPTVLKRKRLMLGVSNIIKENDGTFSLENNVVIETTQLEPDAVEIVDDEVESNLSDDNCKKQFEISNLSDEVKENVIVEEIAVTLDCSKNNVNNDSQVPLLEIEPTNKTQVEPMEIVESSQTTIQIENSQLEQDDGANDIPIKQMTSYHYVDQFSSQLSNNNHETSDENEPTENIEMEVDIIEKVVGKSDETRACVVEKIETCNPCDSSSDESLMNLQQDFISITDDILNSSVKEQEKVTLNHMTEEVENNLVMFDQSETGKDQVEETPLVENSSDSVSKEDESNDLVPIEEEKNHNRTIENSETIENGSHDEDKIVVETGSTSLEDSNLSQAQTIDLLMKKYQELNCLINSINPNQVSNSSLQNLFLVMFSNISNLVQKLGQI